MRGRGKGDRRGGAEDLWVLGSHVLNLMTYFGGSQRLVRQLCTAMDEGLKKEIGLLEKKGLVGWQEMNCTPGTGFPGE